MTTLKLIGRYEIKSEIAKGGMATVFHAYDPRFERDVAIKVLPTAFMHDPQFRVRFEREAKTIALLEHPAIVPVYDFGEQDSQPYIVMRYMSGGSLNERIAEGPISQVETVRILTRLAPALDAAHARNIIHRDLKPGNILFDQYGNAYLSDFGIARIALQGSATLTGEAILGTPAYMSPEQVQGEKDLDGRSDIYSLGVLTFQMLSGQAPYQSDTPAKVMMMHILQPVPNILDNNNDLPEGYQAVISKSMSKKPEDRYATAGEMAADLESVLRGDAGQVSPSTEQRMVSSDRSTRPDYHMTTMMTPGKTVLGSASLEADLPQTKPGETPIEKPLKRVNALTWLIPVAAAALLILVVSTTAALAGRQGRGPLAFLAGSTPTSAPPPTAPPTNTLPPPTETIPVAASLPSPTAALPTPSPLPTEAPPTAPPTEAALPSGPVIGGADKVAYLDGKDIWAANLDGSEQVQLTDDGTSKSNLQWTLEGDAVNYISGKCVYSVKLETRQKEIITCFNFAEYFKSFEISPDGKHIAVSIDNQLYILPNDMNAIRSVSVRDDLTRIAACKDFAPYLRNFVKFPRWSADSSLLGMVIMGVASGIGSADTIQVIPIEECTPSPKALDNFPPPRFTPEEYIAAPMIPNFGWDGRDLFALATYIRNEGFGNLYVYNMDLKKPGAKINPVNGTCCYRDPVWSPDGSHLLFAYQKYPGGDNSIQLYYIPYGTLGTGETYDPLPLPDIQPKTLPQPALRVVRP